MLRIEADADDRAAAMAARRDLAGRGAADHPGIEPVFSYRSGNLRDVELRRAEQDDQLGLRAGKGIEDCRHHLLWRFAGVVILHGPADAAMSSDVGGGRRLVRERHVHPPSGAAEFCMFQPSALNPR